MTKGQNYLSLILRRGYEKVPVEYSMCPSLYKAFSEYLRIHPADFDLEPSFRTVCDLEPAFVDPSVFMGYYEQPLKSGTKIDALGVAHEPGSEAAYHMTYMRHPLRNASSVEEIQSYPFLDFTKSDTALQREQVSEVHKSGLAAMGSMCVTIWESAWYLRGMENLMADMLCDGHMAEALFERITENAVIRAESFARSGVDVLFVGDDIGMQHSVMMSRTMYCEWIKPRLKRVISAAKAVKPDLLVQYHSCGYVTPFIPDLIEAGVDILNSVQPECMDFREIHAMYGDKLSFNGTIGTQKLMPFGSPDDVRREVFRNLDIAGEKGGLLVCPTHLLEPEVPVENVFAYLKACHEYR